MYVSDAPIDGRPMKEVLVGDYSLEVFPEFCYLCAMALLGVAASWLSYSLQVCVGQDRPLSPSPYQWPSANVDLRTGTAQFLTLDPKVPGSNLTRNTVLCS